MTANEIYSLGKESPATAQVPLSLVHTAPHLTFDGHWCAEFLYFLQKFNGVAITVSAPRLLLTFELPSKKLLIRESLNSAGRKMLGSAPELTCAEFYATLNNYLDFCERVTSAVPDAKILATVDALWQKTLPRVLFQWLDNKNFFEEAFIMKNLSELNVDVQETHENAENTEVQETPADGKEVAEHLGYSSDYYQWEMANAIKSGNQIAYDYAKRNYANAKAREETAKVR